MERERERERETETDPCRLYAEHGSGVYSRPVTLSQEARGRGARAAPGLSQVKSSPNGQTSPVAVFLTRAWFSIHPECLVSEPGVCLPAKITPK